MTDDSLESVAAHGIRRRGPMSRVPRWSYAEPPEFGRLIADGAEDGRRWAARRVRRAMAAALSALLLLSAATAGGYMVLSVRARALESERAVMEECSDALDRLSALESRTMAARSRMDDAVSRLDQSYDLDRLVPLSATRPPSAPALSCSADPAEAAARADRAAERLSEWLKPVEAALKTKG